MMPLFAYAQVTLTNPLGETDVRILISRVIQGAISVSGSIAFLMIFYGGFLWLTAAGRPEPITKGKQILIWSILGIAVIASAYVITNAIFGALLQGDVGA